MTIQTLEAPSVDIDREDILRLIPQYYIDSILIRQHLNRELVIGTVGDRGGGKSASDAVIGVASFMIRGKPVWSNMKIRCNIEVDDSIAREWGLNYGGIVSYESLPLDKVDLLKLSDEYRDGCLVIEEINVQYSNVRRFMTNTNINFNEVCQQLRKFKTSLVYNVIDEMFIDSQLRALTDVFIVTYDTGFDLDALSKKRPLGMDFRWKIYPMTGYLRGEEGRYKKTKRYETAMFHFTAWRGIYDDTVHQEKGVYSQSTKELNKALALDVTAESSPEMVAEVNEWGWLDDEAIKLKRAGITKILPYELWKLLKLGEKGISPNSPSFIAQLNSRGIYRNRSYYEISDYSIV